VELDEEKVERYRGELIGARGVVSGAGWYQGQVDIKDGFY